VASGESAMSGIERTEALYKDAEKLKQKKESEKEKAELAVSICVHA
jgi:hypothetical protein